jgi:hypothetical protein
MDLGLDLFFTVRQGSSMPGKRMFGKRIWRGWKNPELSLARQGEMIVWVPG